MQNKPPLCSESHSAPFATSSSSRAFKDIKEEANLWLVTRQKATKNSFRRPLNLQDSAVEATTAPQRKSSAGAKQVKPQPITPIATIVCLDEYS